MKIPNNIKIGPYNYKILKGYKFVEDKASRGHADHCGSMIKMSKVDGGGSPYSKEMIEECFFHEVLHCIDFAYNNAKLEEDQVARLANGIYQTFRDNGLLK